MVPVGPKPRLIHGEDRWGRPEPFWYTTTYGLATPEHWERIQDFQTWPAMEPDAALLKDLNNWPASPYAREIQRKLHLNPAKMTVWEFNLVDPKVPGEWIRFCTPLGESYLVRWTWFDIHVRLPLLKIKAWMLTKLRYNPEW